ncbi:hypothetical protein GGR52DRAFT_103301 [Hypoxylon sp. FL1284]|nr:hypothetical protein GGR52DRAFT_103301 [Hypoxylon sp. FL1284]
MGTAYVTNALAEGLIRGDAKRYFVDNLEEIFNFWTLLLSKTTLPPDTRSTDPSVAAALCELDQTIASSNPLAARLGSVQFTRFIASLQQRIKSERQSGRVLRRGKSDSMAITMYISARGAPTNAQLKQDTGRQIRRSKRWADLAGASPLLVITYTDKAASIMQVS